MKFIITVIFILSSGERVVDTAYTTSPEFCKTTVEMYRRVGDAEKHTPVPPLQDIVAFCRSEGDENSV